ncbi:hypothetical protein GQ457_03G016990 [Hibiscus cannabinus]
MKRGRRRATRKIPAATIVAACIRAEIGVGPSMASEGVEKMPRANVRVPGAEVTHAILPRKARTTFNKRVPVPETDIGG